MAKKFRARSVAERVSFIQRANAAKAAGGRSHEHAQPHARSVRLIARKLQHVRGRGCWAYSHTRTRCTTTQHTHVAMCRYAPATTTTAHHSSAHAFVAAPSTAAWPLLSGRWHAASSRTCISTSHAPRLPMLRAADRLPILEGNATRGQDARNVRHRPDASATAAGREWRRGKQQGWRGRRGRWWRWR